MRHALLWFALTAGLLHAEGREVILVREGPCLSKYVYRSGQLLEQASWSATGRYLGGAGSPYSGLASHYGGGDVFTGSKTSNGETLDDAKLTAAHRTLPIGTLLRVTNAVNGRTCVVRVNDRGPFFHDRVIDLSAAAAKAIGIQQCGLAPVTLAPLTSGPAPALPAATSPASTR
jgi:rare lipoprotein A (peptidoglycan hydrolase)